MNGAIPPERPRKVDRNREAKNERLTRLGLLRGERGDKPRCIHCGQPFDELLSSAGRYGICQSCVDG